MLAEDEGYRFFSPAPFTGVNKCPGDLGLNYFRTLRLQRFRKVVALWTITSLCNEHFARRLGGESSVRPTSALKCKHPRGEGSATKASTWARSLIHSSFRSEIKPDPEYTISHNANWSVSICQQPLSIRTFPAVFLLVLTPHLIVQLEASARSRRSIVCVNPSHHPRLRSTPPR